MIPLIRPERMNNTFRWLTQHIRREDRIRKRKKFKKEKQEK
jgi:hypothetical protein